MHFKCFLAAEARREIFGRSLRCKAQIKRAGASDSVSRRPTKAPPGGFPEQAVDLCTERVSKCYPGLGYGSREVVAVFPMQTAVGCALGHLLRGFWGDRVEMGLGRAGSG